MAQLFMIAIRNLAQHTKRTLLLGGAIAGVTALLVFLLCLSTGIHSTMLESATTLSTGHLNIGGFYKITAGQSAPIVTPHKKIAEIVRKTLPDLDFIAPRGRGWAKIVSDNGSMQAGIGGLDISQEAAFKRVIQIKDGKIDELAKPGTILVFEEQAKKLGVKVGDSMVVSALTSRGVNNTIDVRVAAIAQDIGLLSAWSVYIPDDSLRQLYQINSDATGAIQIYLKDMSRIPQDMDLLRKAFVAEGYVLMDREAKPFWQKFDSVNREDWTGQKLDITTWDEEMSFFKWTIAAIDGLMFVLIAVLLVIIAVGIMNSMWISIRERTREIGTLRAIGMHRTGILAMFMIEAFSLGVLGTSVGALLGILIAVLLNLAHLPVPEGAKMFLLTNTLHLAFDPASILKGMLVITGCTTLVSLIPSTHAARLKPVTAMQHIG